MSNEDPPPIDSIGRNQEASQKGANDLVVMPEAPMQFLTIAERIQGLAVTHSKTLGGEVAANLLAGSVNQISKDLAECKESLKEAQSKLDKHVSEIGRLTTGNEVLKVKLANLSRIRHFSNIGMAIAVAAIGFGVDGVRGTYPQVGIGLLVFGCLLAAFAWFSAPKEDIK